ncbi:MAG TPA: entericidin A/B family lipoprotein [Tepidisphaeraceae bacterium]|jgi:predicted small secreted protein
MNRFRKFRALLMTLVLTSMFATMTGCNTMKGAGRDIERGGEKIQDAADDAQH